LRRIEAGVELRSVVNGNWSWTAGAGVIGRSFRNGAATASLAGLPFFTSGTSLEASLGVKRAMWRVPERRFTVTGSLESPLRTRLQRKSWAFWIDGGLDASGLVAACQRRGRRNSRERRGSNLFGTVPLDQLFDLGLDRDSALWLRGHGATTDGRKGRAPLGRRYVLINSDYDKVIYNGGFFLVLAGPFLDMGKITDDSATFGDPSGSLTPERRLNCAYSEVFRLCFLTAGTYGTDGAHFSELPNVDRSGDARLLRARLEVNDQATANLKLFCDSEYSCDRT